MLVMNFILAAAGKGVTDGQNEQEEAITGTWARDDSDPAMEMGDMGRIKRTQKGRETGPVKTFS